MKIRMVSITVQDQARARDFYTGVLGFRLKHDVPVGEHRWISVVSPDGPDELELVLEPNANPASRTYQVALFEQGIPATGFESHDVAADYEQLTQKGVRFHKPPAQIGTTMLAIFDDTCGNLIQLYRTQHDES